MSDPQQFEIPETVRDLAERNIEQARSAYAQFMDIARQAQDMMTQSQGAMTKSAIDIQARALKFAEKNIEQSFNFAENIARARDLKEYIDIQQDYAQTQMKAYAEQAQELSRLVADAAQKAQPKT